MNLVQQAYDELRQLLGRLPSGQIPEHEIPRVALLLRDCWRMVYGGADTKMGPSKLERMEDVQWSPPSLVFQIERHGGTVLGSTRGERQRWMVNLDTREAKCETAGYRQLYKRDTSFDVKPVAEELSNLIISKSQDKRLQWSASGRVRVLTGSILPGGHSKQTLQGRRKRLFKAMEGHLSPHGWRRLGSWWESRSDHTYKKGDKKATDCLELVVSRPQSTNETGFCQVER